MSDREPGRRPEWWPVARWELRRVLLRGDFIVALIVLPLAIVGISAGSAFLARKAADQELKLALVSQSPRVSATLAPFDSIPGVRWVTVTGAGAEPAALERAVRDRTVEGAVIVPGDFATGGAVGLLARREDPSWVRRLHGPFREAARELRAVRAGADPAALGDLDAPVAFEERSVLPSAGSERMNRLAGVIMMALLIAALYATSAYLMISISGEKQARVTEVVVSAIRPQSWIDGKIAAFTVIGLLQAVIWGVSLFGVALFLAWSIPPGLQLGVLALDLLFLVLGFAFYIAFFSAILATIKDMQSTSKFQAYLYFLPILPFVFLEPIVENPESLMAMVLSWVPFFSPTLMPARLAMGAVAPWEVLLSAGLLAGATWLMRLAAGHAFRIGMLMYGKELNLPELVRWARSEREG